MRKTNPPERSGVRHEASTPESPRCIPTGNTGGIEHCEQLVSFEISLNDRLHDLGLLGSLAHLRHVEMGFCGFKI